jgi:SAM-dependent methyltransferase
VEALPKKSSSVNHEMRHKLRGHRQSIAYHLARAFTQTPLRRFGFRNPEITRFDSMEAWTSSRLEECDNYHDLFRRFTSFEGKTVLDLGCNRGYLLNAFLEKERFKGIGADISEVDLQIARESYGDLIKFVRSTPASVPLPDASIDIAYTIDTVEHLSETREIFMDIHRVLKDGGLFLVHFNPWLNPYGSHLEDIIPYPWPHVFFPMNVLLDAAAVLYEEQTPEQTAAYFRDATGARMPNPYLDRAKWDRFLNYMTIRRFNRMLEQLPFEVVHQEALGFGGKTFKAGRLVRGLANVPIAREFFTNALFTVLRK